jgi:hypothetical protein
LDCAILKPGQVIADGATANITANILYVGQTLPLFLSVPGE